MLMLNSPAAELLSPTKTRYVDERWVAMRRQLLRNTPSCVAFLWMVFLPAFAWAQASIVGLVRDESGAVLPGVTVEAASPALIEGMRTAVTDDQGRYRVEALRPGPYKLTFTLAGFTTF